MAYGIGKDIRLACLVIGVVLLRTKNYGLSAIDTVDAVDGLVETAHTGIFLGSDVEEVVLHGHVGCNTHHYHPRLLVFISRDKDGCEGFLGSRYDCDCGI